MFKNLKIQVDGQYSVYGQLSGSLKKPLVVLVHGLCGSMQEGLIHEAAQWFASHGYATFRFNLYGWQKDARQLVDCTLKIHACDIDAVVRFFRRRGVKKMYLAGHSYGGPTILQSKDQDFDAAVLWDPSYKMVLTKGKHAGKYVKSLNGYFMRWGVNVVIGKKLADEANKLEWKKLTECFHAPLKIISAGNGELVEGARYYYKTANKPKSFDIIKEATHYFDDKEGMREEVYRISKKWFEAHR